MDDYLSLLLSSGVLIIGLVVIFVVLFLLHIIVAEVASKAGESGFLYFLLSLFCTPIFAILVLNAKINGKTYNTLSRMEEQLEHLDRQSAVQTKMAKKQESARVKEHALAAAMPAAPSLEDRVSALRGKNHLFYCRNCAKAFIGTGEDESFCPNCGEKLAETGFTPEAWKALTAEEKAALKESFSRGENCVL